MDFSKLPKLSETKASEPAPAAATPPGETPPASPPTRKMDYRPPPYEPTGVGAEVWFGAIIGLVLMLFARTFGSYLIALVAHQPFHTGVTWTAGPLDGQEVPYTQLEGGTFYSDSSIFLFGAALMIGALAQAVLASRFSRKREVAWLSLACMAAATLYNIVAIVVLLRNGVTPLMSLLCVAIGGYIVYYEWSAVKAAEFDAAREQ